jgi:hypothetical protein
MVVSLPSTLPGITQSDHCRHVNHDLFTPLLKTFQLSAFRLHKIELFAKDCSVFHDLSAPTFLDLIPFYSLYHESHPRNLLFGQGELFNNRTCFLSVAICVSSALCS